MANMNDYKFYKSDKDVPATYNYYMYLKQRSPAPDTKVGVYIMRMNSANTEALYAFVTTDDVTSTFNSRASFTYKNLSEWEL